VFSTSPGCHISDNFSAQNLLRKTLDDFASSSPTTPQKNSAQVFQSFNRQTRFVLPAVNQYLYLPEKGTPNFFGITNIWFTAGKRSGSGGLKVEDLRAIPFVGSWR